jgi:hypothetical protein
VSEEENERVGGLEDYCKNKRLEANNAQNVIYHFDIQQINHPLPLLPAAHSLAKEGSHRLVFIVKKAHISPPWCRTEPGKEGPGVVNGDTNH